MGLERGRDCCWVATKEDGRARGATGMEEPEVGREVGEEVMDMERETLCPLRV